MGDEIIHNVLALVMVYDDASHQWLPCGNALQYANIYILYNAASKIYRFYGIDSKDGEIILDSEIYKGLKYNKATPIFHQWRDISRQVFGLKFESPEDAEGFSTAVLSVLDPAAQKTHRRSTEVPPSSTQLSGVVEQTNKANARSSQINTQQPTMQSGINQIWASQEQADSGKASSLQNSRIAHAEPAPMQARPTQIEPAVSQNSQLRTVAADPTPFQTRIQQAEPAVPATQVKTAQSDTGNDQNRWSQTGAAINQPSMLRRMSSQPSYETNSSSGSQSVVDDVHPIVSRHRSGSYGNALEDTVKVTTRLSQPIDQTSNHAGAPPLAPPQASSVAPAPPPPPPPVPAGPGGLEEALRTATLRRTAKPPPDEASKNLSSGGTLPRSAGRGVGLDMMSEMTRRLQERRAKAGEAEGGAPVKNQTTNGSTDEKPLPATPAKTTVPLGGGKDSPKSERKWQPPQPSTGASTPSNVATTADLDNLKKELTTIMRNEIATAKQEILAAISKLLNR